MELVKQYIQGVGNCVETAAPVNVDGFQARKRVSARELKIQDRECIEKSVHGTVTVRVPANKLREFMRK